MPIIKVIPVKYSCLYWAADQFLLVHQYAVIHHQRMKNRLQTLIPISLILVSFSVRWVFISALWKVESYLLSGIKVPGRNGRYWRHFVRTNYPKTTWFVDVTSELLFPCADFCMSLFFMALILESSTWPIELFYRRAHDYCVFALLRNAALYYALF